MSQESLNVNASQPKRVVIAGGSGFLGVSLAYHLAAASWQVTILSRNRPLGSGHQGMSWIHEVDMNRLFERGLTDHSMIGVYVASSPNPVSNSEFMRSLRQAVPWPKVPLALPACEWMVRIGAPLLLRTDPEIALYGRYVTSSRLQREGFAFSYPRLPEALAACFAQPTRKAEQRDAADSWYNASKWMAPRSRAAHRNRSAKEYVWPRSLQRSPC